MVGEEVRMGSLQKGTLAFIKKMILDTQPQLSLLIQTPKLMGKLKSCQIMCNHVPRNGFSFHLCRDWRDKSHSFCSYQ